MVARRAARVGGAARTGEPRLRWFRWAVVSAGLRGRRRIGLVYVVGAIMMGEVAEDLAIRSDDPARRDEDAGSPCRPPSSPAKLRVKVWVAAL